MDRSQYLAAAIDQLRRQPQGGSPAGMGANLGAQALMQMAQQRAQTPPGAPGMPPPTTGMTPDGSYSPMTPPFAPAQQQGGMGGLAGLSRLMGMFRGR